MAAAQARRKGPLRRAGGMRYSPLQCCHAEAPLGRTQRGDGGHSPPLPGRVCRLAFGVRELPLAGAVAVTGPSRSVPFRTCSSRLSSRAGCPSDDEHTHAAASRSRVGSQTLYWLQSVTGRPSFVITATCGAVVAEASELPLPQLLGMLVGATVVRVQTRSIKVASNAADSVS